MKILNEMTLTRSDSIDRCISLGEKFIEHFDKIYKNPTSIDRVHWEIEMNSWYNSIKKIILKSNNKPLTKTNRVDWFYSFGSLYELYFDDERESKVYKMFIDKLEESNDVHKSIEEVL